MHFLHITLSMEDAVVYCLKYPALAWRTDSDPCREKGVSPDMPGLGYRGGKPGRMLKKQGDLYAFTASFWDNRRSYAQGWKKLYDRTENEKK